MKNKIVLIFLSFICFHLNAQNSEKEVILIKVYEGYKGCIMCLLE